MQPITNMDYKYNIAHYIYCLAITNMTTVISKTRVILFYNGLVGLLYKFNYIS